MPPAETVEVSHGLYRIRQSAGEPVPLERHPRLFKLSNVITWSLWFLYITFQFSFAWSVQTGTGGLLWRMWIVLFAEVCLSFQEVVLAINTILALFGASETRARPLYRLIGNSAPTVDVFIPCCGEPNDVIVDTLAAALAQDYPSGRFRVFLLDDGHDGTLKEVVEFLGKKSAEKNGPQVQYLSRSLAPGVKSYFKAGNLQFGIEETARLGGSDYLASLDADMIPEPDWLRRIIPHLILKDELALACPPQRYYNVLDGDPLGQQAEFDIWFTVFEPLNDRLDAAMCTGSGFVVKRSALTDIGGWPLVDAGEDFMCSALLSNAGWKVGFIREDLQFGLAPKSLRAHVKQRMRWVDSGIEVHKQFGFYLPGSKMTSQMTWIQRGVGILQALREYAPITNILALILLPVAIYPTRSDEFATIIASSGQDHRLWLLRSLFLAVFVAHKLNDYIVYGHVGLHRLASFQSMDIWCAPYTATRCILSLLPPSLTTFITSPTFTVSGSITSSANERSRTQRQPLPYRLLSADMCMYAAYVVYACVPLVACARNVSAGARNSGLGSGLGGESDSDSDPAWRLELDLGLILIFPGAVLKLLDGIAKAAVPVWYMAWPPTVEERGELMRVDDGGVRRPIERGGLGTVGSEDGGWSWGWTWRGVCEVGLVAWWVCCWW